MQAQHCTISGEASHHPDHLPAELRTELPKEHLPSFQKLCTTAACYEASGWDPIGTLPYLLSCRPSTLHAIGFSNACLCQADRTYFQLDFQGSSASHPNLYLSLQVAVRLVKRYQCGAFRAWRKQVEWIRAVRAKGVYLNRLTLSTTATQACFSCLL